MIGHVWIGGPENHSSQKKRLHLGMAVNAWLLCILDIRFSYVQSQNTRHHTQSTLAFAFSFPTRSFTFLEMFRPHETTGCGSRTARVEQQAQDTVLYNKT